MVVLNGGWAQRVGRDKVATGLAGGGRVPTVDTVGLLPDVAGLAMSAGDAEPDLPPGTGVVKPARGHSGDLVTRVADGGAAVGAFWQAMRSRATTTAVEAVVAQPLVVSDGDVRAYVVAGELAGLMRRRPGRMRMARQRAAGGYLRAAAVVPPGADLAVRAVAALGLDAAGWT